MTPKVEVGTILIEHRPAAPLTKKVIVLDLLAFDAELRARSIRPSSDTSAPDTRVKARLFAPTRPVRLTR